MHTAIFFEYVFDDGTTDGIVGYKTLNKEVLELLGKNSFPPTPYDDHLAYTDPAIFMKIISFLNDNRYTVVIHPLGRYAV